MSGTIAIVGRPVRPKYPDDQLLKLGTDNDIVMLLRSAALNANTALANVLEGTPVTPALAANSLIISNITDDGDILIAASDGGNSKAGIWIDASAPYTYLYNGILGDDLVLNGKIFDAGSSNAEINTTGSGKGLLIKSTSTGNVVRLNIQLLSGSAADDDYLEIKFDGYNDKATPETIDYGYIRCFMRDISETTEDSEFNWLLQNAGSANVAMTLSSAGLVWADVGFNADEYYQVAGTQVVGARVIDARCDDAINSGDATTDGVIDALRDAMITHGLIAAA